MQQSLCQPLRLVLWTDHLCFSTAKNSELPEEVPQAFFPVVYGDVFEHSITQNVAILGVSVPEKW